MNAEPRLSHAPDTRLRGSGLWLARLGWAAGAVLTLGAFAALLPAYDAQLRTVCSGVRCAFVQPTPASAEALARIGISVGGYATAALAVTVLGAVAATAIGVLMVLRRPDDWRVLLNAFVVIPLGTASMTYAVQESQTPWYLLALVLNVLTFGAFFLAAGLFPDGRFVPRWVRWVPVIWLVWSGVFYALRALPAVHPAHIAVWLGCCSLLMIGQAYRYRFVSTPAQQQQTKWIIFGASATVLLELLAQAARVLVPSFGEPGSIFALLTEPVSQLMDLVFIVSIAIAILRYRLFDIDVIINRALVYGSLTVALAVVYFSGVLLLQATFQRLAGQGGSAPAIVISTLAIAALFHPIRQRIQTEIDRRFYRRKYDAARTVEAFSATLRGELDLAGLSERLVAVVEEAMQPAHISLWVCPPRQREERREGP
jgi:hypothetical protein